MYMYRLCLTNRENDSFYTSLTLFLCFIIIFVFIERSHKTYGKPITIWEKVILKYEL